MNSEVSCDRRILNAHPLMTMTKFDVSIVFNSGKRRINNVRIQNILRIVRFLLRVRNEQAAYPKQQKENSLHSSYFYFTSYLIMVTDPVIGSRPFFG